LLQKVEAAGRSLVVVSVIIINITTMMIATGSTFWQGTKYPIASIVVLAYSQPPTKQVQLEHVHRNQQQRHHQQSVCYSRCIRQQQQFFAFHPNHDKKIHLHHHPSRISDAHWSLIHTTSGGYFHCRDDNTKTTILQRCHGQQLQRQRPLLLCAGGSTTVATLITTNWRSSTTQRSAAVGTEDSNSCSNSNYTNGDNSDNQIMQKQGHDNSAVDNVKTKSIIPRAAVSSCIRCSVIINNGDSQESSSTKEDKGRDCCYQYYLLVQRGKQPNKGIWSFPGGKIEYGESTINGAIRELSEEVQIIMDGASLFYQAQVTMQNEQKQEDSRLVQIDNNNWKGLLKWYKDPVTTSDSIGESYHYLIAQCFGEMTILLPPAATSSNAKVELLSSTCTDGMKYTVDDDNHDYHHYHYKSFLPQLHASDDAMDASWFTKIEIQQMERNETATRGIINVIHRIEELSESGLLPLLH
jgi:NUDIX domain